jgi:hypothetical protein
LKPEFAFTEQETAQGDINSDHYSADNQDEDTSETGGKGNEFVDEAQNHSDQGNSQDGISILSQTQKSLIGLLVAW